MIQKIIAKIKGRLRLPVVSGCNRHFSKSYCIECGEEMRKWIAEDDLCYAMCLNDKCSQHRIAVRDITNTNNFKLECSCKL
jgi:hypothetical protein